MLREIVAFEWRYHARQVSFLAATVLFFALGFFLTASGYGPKNIYVDSPYAIMQATGLLTLAAIFLVTVFCANAVVRDREYRMEEIVFSTAVSKWQYLCGRFTGSFLAAFTAFSASAVGMFAARFLPTHDPSRVGPIQVSAYLWALLVMALPNLLLAAALLFAASTLTRSVLASYVAAVFLYVLYFAGAILTNSPLMAASVPGGSSASLGVLLDPFGLSAFFEQTRYWPPEVRNARLLSLTGNFLLNRAGVLVAAVIIWTVVYKLFSFRVLSGKRAKQETLREVVEPVAYEPVAPAPSVMRAFASAARIEIASLLKSVPFLLLMLLWAGLAISEIQSTLDVGEYGAAILPTVGIVFSSLRQPLYLIGLVMLIYYSTEIVWRERSVRMAPILDASPAPNEVFVASKITALSVLVLALVLIENLVAVLSGVAFHLTLNAQFAYYDALPLIFFAILAVFVHTISRQKYAGMFLLIAFVIVRERGFGHRLWRFGSGSPVAYSDMTGFEGASLFHWYMLNWLIVAALLVLVAAAYWRSDMRERLSRPAIAVLAVLLITSSAHIYAIDHHPDALALRADYEKTYKSIERPRPLRVESVTATIDMTDGGAHIRGQYVLVNDAVVVADRLSVLCENASVTMQGAKLAEHNERFGHFLFTFNQPLKPGQHAILQFDINAPASPLLMSNGSFPSLGYRKGYELTDPVERRKRGLPPRPDDDTEGDLDTGGQEWASLDLTISTPRNETAVTTGRLDRDWIAGDRHYVRYVTDQPVPNGFAIASAQYATARDGAVALYYHAAHKQNVARMLKAANDSLHYYEANYGPYPYKQLKLVEVPAQFSIAGFARPDTIFLGENRTFLVDTRNPEKLDLVTRRVAHEVSHQWWGLNVAPAIGPGASTITESLAKYSELMILEHTYGREAIRRSLTNELDLYLAGRAEARKEVPLERAAGNEPYLYYRKGAIVMYALKELLGEANVNRALSAFFQEESGPRRRPDTSQLLAHLYEVATPEQHALIDDWFKRSDVVDLSMQSASARPTTGGKFEVTMAVIVSKANGPIEIGLFDERDQPLIVGKHTLNQGANSVTVIADKLPATAVVDPYTTRVDSDRFNNSAKVQTVSSPRSTVTALPASFTRSPSSVTRKVPPRGDA